MSVTVKVDLSTLEAKFVNVKKNTFRNADAAVTPLVAEAKQSAIDLINLQIYDTPRRGRYIRTKKLKESIHAEKEKRGNTRWSIVLGAVGGAGGRKYALFNERGTRGGRVSLKSIKARAEAAAQHTGLIHLQYGDPGSGLEPRPWVIPTLVMIAAKFPELFLTAVREGWEEAEKRTK